VKLNGTSEEEEIVRKNFYTNQKQTKKNKKTKKQKNETNV